MSVSLLLVALAGLMGQDEFRDTGKRLEVYPEVVWQTRRPEQEGLDQSKLDALRDLVGGRGCVVRHGYMVYAWGEQSKSGDVASACKPVISTLLLLAVQEGKIRSVDEKVSGFELRLKTLNGGKDGRISWRHLASQSSGYGLREKPGQAYAYNDFALALYYDVLTQKVFRDDGTRILKTRLADALQFEDRYTFDAFGPGERSGRLAVSVRDFARFGLLYLRGGKWNGKQIIRPDLIKTALSSPVDADLPLTSGTEAEVLPGQRSLGGGKNITPVGPGFYSFNWWLNRTDKRCRRLYADAPPDTYVACGHGGIRMLWILPSLDMVVAWNDTTVNDHDASPGNRETKCNRAARLLRQAVIRHSESPETAAFVPRTRVGIRGDRWQINGKATYPGAKAEGLLLNVRMVNAVFEDRNCPGFDAQANTEKFVAMIPNYTAAGVRAVTLGLQGGFPGYEGAVNSAFLPDGSLNSTYMKRVGRVIEECDRHGIGVILGCFYQRQDQVLEDEQAVRRGVAAVAQWIKDRGYTNVALEIANEFPHRGFDHRILKTADGEVDLIRLARQANPGLMVSTSGIGDGKLSATVARASDFLLIHFNGVPVSALPARIHSLKKYGKPIVCNEDDKTGAQAAQAAEACVANGASWGLMLEKTNQHFPFSFRGPDDDRVVYTKLAELTAIHPTIKKLGTIDLLMVETTPVVFKDRLYRFEYVRDNYHANKTGASYFRFIDVAAGKASPGFAKGLHLGCAFVEGETMYVFGVDKWNGSKITLFRSKDLSEWQSQLALTLPGWGLFNTSVCKADGRYVMAIEVGEPKEVVGVAFTTFFAESKDLLHWKLLSQKCVYSKEKYTACPALRYLDGFFYMIYLEARPGPTYETHVVRSKDLIRWESSRLNPVLAFSADDKAIRNPNLTPEQQKAISHAKNINNSDVDLCEFQGKTIINYSWGNQQGIEFLAEAVYEGSLAEFLRGFFP